MHTGDPASCRDESAAFRRNGQTIQWCWKCSGERIKTKESALQAMHDLLVFCLCTGMVGETGLDATGFLGVAKYGSHLEKVRNAMLREARIR